MTPVIVLMKIEKKEVFFSGVSAFVVNNTQQVSCYSECLSFLHDQNWQL